jgi:hypothetical protein
VFFEYDYAADSPGEGRFVAMDARRPAEPVKLLGSL